MIKFKIPKSMAEQFSKSMLIAGAYAILAWSEDELFEGAQICGYLQQGSDPEKNEAFRKEYTRFLTNLN